MYYAAHCIGRYPVVGQVGDGSGFSKQALELRRGVVVLAALSQLRRPQYGYSLRKALGERGMPIEEGTLYPLLRRLEQQGLLDSEWRLEDGPPRRYYVLNERGATLLAELAGTWRDLNAVVGRLLEEDS